MKNLIQRFIREEDGQDLIEYALLAAIIAIGAVVAMRALSTQINNTFQTTANTLASPSGS
jgi:pilus assembly protein Flp/PilA